MALDSGILHPRWPSIAYGFADGSYGWGSGMNANLKAIATLTLPFALDFLSTPPGSPAEGDCYLTSSGVNGAWVGHPGEMAIYLGSAWKFYTLPEGCPVYVRDEYGFFIQTGGASRPAGVNYYSVIRAGNCPNTTPMFQDFTDSTKKATMVLSNVGAGTTRVITMPNKNVTLMSSAGDTMTGALVMAGKELTKPKILQGHYISTEALSSASASVNVALGNYFNITLDGNWTPLLTGWATTTGTIAEKIVIRVKQTASFTINWGTIKWVGTAPTMTTGANKIDIYKFYSFDGGTTIYGVSVGQNFV